MIWGDGPSSFGRGGGQKGLFQRGQRFTILEPRNGHSQCGLVSRFAIYVADTTFRWGTVHVRDVATAAKVCLWRSLFTQELVMLQTELHPNCIFFGGGGE